LNRTRAATLLCDRTKLDAEIFLPAMSSDGKMQGNFAGPPLDFRNIVLTQPDGTSLAIIFSKDGDR
jgi:hypothetical protein